MRFMHYMVFDGAQFVPSDFCTIVKEHQGVVEPALRGMLFVIECHWERQKLMVSFMNELNQIHTCDFEDRSMLCLAMHSRIKSD